MEDLLHERGIDVSHETVRYWWNHFGPLFAGDIRSQRVSRMRGYRQWQWHLDEMYVKVNGEMRMKKAMERFGNPEAVTTDGLRSYRAAMTELGNAAKQHVGRWANNRVENSHLPFRRRQRAMLRFRQMKTLQKFASVHANVHNHFNTERHLVDRSTYKILRWAGLAEWRSLMA